MNTITPSLWFDASAQEAMELYTSLFENSRIVSVKKYPEGMTEEHMKGMEGKVLHGEFELCGQRFVALDGGPVFTFNPSISFFVYCTSTEEIEQLWQELSKDGKELMPLSKYDFSEKYGWIQDRFGISWQLFVTDQPAPQKIAPGLMFTGEKAGSAEAAITFYTSVFKNSKSEFIARYEEGHSPDKAGTVMHASFVLDGYKFITMDSALEHGFTFNEAISFIIDCADQQEVDYFWEKLSAVPESEQCGWVKDKFGISWQIIPKQLGELIGDPDPEKSNRVLQAMLQMKKIDIASLQKAHQG